MIELIIQGLTDKTYQCTKLLSGDNDIDKMKNFLSNKASNFKKFHPL